MLHVIYVDRGGAHSIWRLMDGIAREVLNQGGRVSYVRMLESGAIDPLQTPRGVEVTDIYVPRKRYPWHRRTQLYAYASALRAILKKCNASILHSNFCVPGNVARRIAKREFGIPVVTTCHEMYGSMNPLLRYGVRRTEKYADAIVYISRAVGDSYLASFDPDEQGVDRRQPKHRLIYNGIDVDFIQRIVAGIDQQERDWALSRRRLVSVGRLVREKGHALVVRALPELLRQFPDLEYHIYGEGPERANLNALALELQVRDRLYLHGWVDFAEAVKQMALASVVVLPSLHEGFGLALAEAMLTKKPIVAADIAAFREIVGVANLRVSLAPLDSPEAFLTSIRMGLELKRGCFNFSGTSSEPSNVGRFSVEAMVNSYLNVYWELICPQCA